LRKLERYLLKKKRKKEKEGACLAKDINPIKVPNCSGNQKTAFVPGIKSKV